jgi:hypothetical protein
LTYNDLRDFLNAVKGSISLFRQFIKFSLSQPEWASDHRAKLMEDGDREVGREVEHQQLLMPQKNNAQTTKCGPGVGTSEGFRGS